MEFEEIKAGLERYCKDVEEKLKTTKVVMPRQYQKFYSLEAMNCYRQDCLMRVKGACVLPFFCDSHTCPARISQNMIISTTCVTNMGGDD